MPFIWPAKDPEEIYPYVHNWTDRITEIEGDTIVSTECIVESGEITKESESTDGFFHKVWLSGGVEGTTVKFTLRAITTAGCHYDEGILLKIAQR